jgi:hypothetical protein
MMDRRWILSFIAAVVVLLVIEIAGVGVAGLGGFVGIPIPGFFAVLGFVGCALIILASKWVGRYWLQRRENYYEETHAG